MNFHTRNNCSEYFADLQDLALHAYECTLAGTTVQMRRPNAVALELSIIKAERIANSVQAPTVGPLPEDEPAENPAESIPVPDEDLHGVAEEPQAME